ncbi:glycosyltransferase [Afifella sp. IM 167]|uniref:glycosyltransferase n=1 Tax=Afifella sp. IM 167 TaxID=2033586 RepID=UPI001CCB2C87|nr:glycosyltransferase [Afifella sp. IM 167]MBZ8134257.1 hypothetical protein [Afifella sp. IM 167]
MRTYGAHGGENQLASYFASGPDGDVSESFAFVYRDGTCRALFAARGVELRMFDLWPSERKTGGAWQEVLALLPILPLLQWRLARLAHRLRAEVCVVHGIQAALVAWPLAVLRGRSIRFLYVHRIAKASGRSGLARLLYRPFALLAGNSRAVARSLEGLAPPERVVALENGVDMARLEERATAAADVPPPKGRVLIAVGRLLPHKRQALLIEALARLSPAHPDLVLWVVGDGTERAALEDLAKSLGVDGRVTFFGHRNDVPVLLKNADVFVNASAWEGMSNAVLEAMAMGLPSVVAEAPGVSECHENGVTGFVTPGDCETIAKAVGRLIEDAGLREEMAANARRRVESQYSIEVARGRYLDVYRRLAREAA